MTPSGSLRASLVTPEVILTPGGIRMLSKQVPFRLPLTKAKEVAATTREDTTTKVVSTNRVLISKVDLISGVVTATITHRVVTTKQDMNSHMTPITVDMVAVTGATMVLMGISNK